MIFWLTIQVPGKFILVVQFDFDCFKMKLAINSRTETLFLIPLKR